MSFPRKRSGSNSKKQKEKYEVLFKNDETEELSENMMLEIINNSHNINLENLELDIGKSYDLPAVKKNLSQFMRYCINNCNAEDDGEIC